MFFQPLGDVIVMVPIPGVDVDTARPRLDQAAREQRALSVPVATVPIALLLAAGAAALIGFNYGGSFALFPAITADYFGNKNVGSNYGWMFTAYGVAGLAGPLLAGYFKDAAQGSAQPEVWMTPFVIAGAVCLLGAVIMAFTTRPRRVPPSVAASTGRRLATEMG